MGGSELGGSGRQMAEDLARLHLGILLPIIVLDSRQELDCRVCSMPQSCLQVALGTTGKHRPGSGGLGGGGLGGGKEGGGGLGGGVEGGSGLGGGGSGGGPAGTSVLHTECIFWTS